MNPEIKPRNRKSSLRLIPRQVPVFLLVLSFFAVIIIPSLNRDVAAEAESMTIAESSERTAGSSLCDLQEFTPKPLKKAKEPDFTGIEFTIKKFTFEDLPEGMETSVTEKDEGLSVVTRMIKLDADDFEETIKNELSEDDFDIAYAPYKETISVIKENGLYKELSMLNGKCMLSFNGENIGIITNQYPAAGLFYNRDILEEAGLEDPMILYSQGRWTLESFYNYLEKTSIDRNNDGINDIFGIVINEDLTDNLAAANGIDIISMNSEGKIELKVNDLGFKRILDLINRIYSNGYKGGMSTQGFIDGRACFYNDDASAFRGLQEKTGGDIGFVCYPSDISMVRSASAKVEVAVVNKNRELDEDFLKMLCIATSPSGTAEEYFRSIFADEEVVSMCVEMTVNNYISPIYMFSELHDFYLDMLRDIKAGFNVSETVETFGSGPSDILANH